MIGISVDGDFRLLAGMHIFKVGFLEIGFHPDIVLRDNAHNRRADTDIVAHLRLAAKHTVKRCPHCCPRKVQRCVIAQGFGADIA